MLFLPHQVLVLAGAQQRDPETKTVYAPTFAPAKGNRETAIACQITPEKATVAFEALGVPITNPQTLLCEVADAPRFTLEARVQPLLPASWAKRLFRVAGPPQTYEMGTAADCGRVLLEELTDLED